MKQPTLWLSCACVVCLAVLICVSRPVTAQTRADTDHVAWVQSTMQRMATIEPGMTRAELLAVFTTEGGISSRLHRTFVSRDCPNFKVDVEFRAVGPEGEDPRDTIVKISRPYLAWPVGD